MNKKRIAVAVIIIAAFIVTYIGVEIYASSVAEGKVNEFIARNSNVADIDYNMVSVRLLGMDVMISNVVLSPIGTSEKIKIEEIIVHEFDSSSDIPAFLSLECNGIEYNLSSLGEDADQLRKLGYTDKMIMDLHVDYIYDREEDVLDVKNIGIGADEVGELSVGFHLGNVSLEPEELALLFFTFPKVMFHEAKMIYKDDSLTDRMIRAAAEEEQKSEKEFRKEMLRDLEKQIAAEEDEFTRSALSEIKNFLKDPGRISISASPSQPHPLGRIMGMSDPKDLIRLLEIEIDS